ncbi:hypothetical protein BT69DRAFT_461864 [Atractiella rhizophila]|nr:hypothetical protein BT69DRAFT_461864 [Atractiella rhizophila]
MECRFLPLNLHASNGLPNFFSPQSTSQSFLPPTGVLSRTNGHTMKRGRTTEHHTPYMAGDRSSLTSLDSGDELIGQRRPTSLQFTTGANGTSSGVTTPGGFSLMNEGEENYVWDRQDSQLYPANSERGRAAVGRPHNDTITFPPRSYTRVFEQDHELFPSTGNSNAWLKHQSCLPNCRFRSKAKRPAVIRAHLATCKLRTSLENDPLKRLCKLQMDAMRHKRAHLRSGEQDSLDFTSEGNDTEEGDTDHTDHTRSSSEISFDHPDGGLRPVNLSKDANAAASLGLSLTITDGWPESLSLFGFDPLTDTSADLLSALPSTTEPPIQIPPGLTFGPMY